VTKTTLPTQESLWQARKWHHLDADGKVLGRLASRAAVLLKGKHKRLFTPSLDCGDFVVVTNAKKIKVTGDKEATKFYFRHSGYAGGAKNITYRWQMEKDPTVVIYLAVKRMLDDNKLRGKQLKRLKIYAGEAHPHAANRIEVANG
jgi:large subunit ribosomal protein L13